MSKQVKHFYEFDSFRVDPEEQVLFRDGEPVPLSPKIFDTLLVLVRESGHIVEKDDLIKQVWPDTFVEENNLSQYISTLRRTLGDGRHEQRYIETVPRRGYRFADGVREVWDDNGAVVGATHTRVSLVVREESEEKEELIRAENLSNARSTHSRNRVFLAAGILLFVGAIATLSWRSNRTNIITEASKTEPNVTTPFRSLAVLPFKTIGAEKENEYLGLGIADTLIAKLSRVRQISVRPVSAVHRYTGLAQDPVAAGRELKVDVVLDGRIQQADGRIRATVEMWNAREGARLWTQTLDVKRTDIFTLQDEIAARVTSALPSALSQEEGALVAKRHTTNPEAYEAYLKGRYFWNKRTTEDFRKAFAHFQKAIAIDPNYALAFAALADCYAIGRGAVKAPRKKMEEAANRALELDETLAEPRAALAYYQGALDWEWEEAEKNFQQAISLNPNYATARHWHAYNLVSIGRLTEAIAEIKQAQELDPLSIIIVTDVGHILYFARQYDEAIAQYRKALEMDANFAIARWRLGEAYVQKGMYTEAIAEMKRALALYPNNVSIMSWLGYAQAFGGNRNATKQILAEVKRRQEQDHFHTYNIALIHAALGEKEEAFSWLEKAVEEHNSDLALILSEPMLDNFRSDTRFVSLLRRMNLTSIATSAL